MPSEWSFAIQPLSHAMHPPAWDDGPCSQTCGRSSHARSGSQSVVRQAPCHAPSAKIGAGAVTCRRARFAIGLDGGMRGIFGHLGALGLLIAIAAVTPASAQTGYDRRGADYQKFTIG